MCEVGAAYGPDVPVRYQCPVLRTEPPGSKDGASSVLRSGPIRASVSHRREHPVLRTEPLRF